MDALVLLKRGTRNNLRYTKINTPVPKKGEALVKVDYCGLNHLDLLVLQGKRKVDFPHILGSEIVGTVVLTEGLDKKYKIGDQVIVYPWFFCGKCNMCKIGNENICDNGGTIGRSCWGGYAEYVSVPVQNLLKIPPKVKKEMICAITLAGTTAHHLIDRAKVRDQSIVLVTGATGGVGTIVMQLLKQKKCIVLCTTSHKDKAPFLKSLGADLVISTNNLKEEVKKLYPRGVDYVVDIIGGQVWSQALETLGKNGTIVFCATTFDDLGVVNIANTFSKQLNILGSYGGRIKDLKAVIKLLKKGVIKPAIDSIIPYEEAKIALKKLEEQKVAGKIILQF